MRTVLALLAMSSLASADAPYRLVEDAALGIALPTDKRLLDDTQAGDAIAKCLTATPASGSAVVWIQLSSKGAVTTTRVHGTGKPVLDACLATALKKVTPVDRPAAPFAVVGRLDLAGPDGAYLASPRVSSAAVLVQPHQAAWQLTVNRIGYTSNRAQDIATALDGQSAAIAACAGKRGAKAQPAEALAWIAGKQAAFQSGNRAYDACVAKALQKIALPADDSALWMHVAIMKPAEPLAPRTTKAGLSKADALRDAMTTAVRSRKQELLACLDGKPNARLLAVAVALKGGKANIAKVSTGNIEADACVRNKFRDIPIPNAAASDTAQHSISLEPVSE